MFSAEIREIIEFLSEFFSVFGGEISHIYLNRRVFVMEVDHLMHVMVHSNYN